jgi:hypothetical protein
MIAHIVTIKAKQGREQEVQDSLDRFASLIASEPGVHNFASGPNIFTKSLEVGWTHALLVDLDDAETMQRYQSHPDHVVLLQELDDSCEARLAVDFLRRD